MCVNGYGGQHYGVQYLTLPFDHSYYAETHEGDYLVPMSNYEE